jgi:hypothetical protein
VSSPRYIPSYRSNVEIPPFSHSFHTPICYINPSNPLTSTDQRKEAAAFSLETRVYHPALLSAIQHWSRIGRRRGMDLRELRQWIAFKMKPSPSSRRTQWWYTSSPLWKIQCIRQCSPLRIPCRYTRLKSRNSFSLSARLSTVNRN